MMGEHTKNRQTGKCKKKRTNWGGTTKPSTPWGREVNFGGKFDQVLLKKRKGNRTGGGTRPVETARVSFWVYEIGGTPGENKGRGGGGGEEENGGEGGVGKHGPWPPN